MVVNKFDLFSEPYIQDKTVINNYEEAIKALASKNGYDPALANAINDRQDNNEQFKTLKSKMPSESSKIMRKYQDEPKSTDKDKINTVINSIDCKLAKGQQILHGGHFEEDDFITDKPLSTTTDPQVAFREAEYLKKAFNNNRIDINILVVKESNTSIYVFETEGTDHSNEREILFASGAHLKKVKEIKLTDDYEVFDEQENMKKIPLHLKKYEIS